jgi:hypothetical protein
MMYSPTVQVKERTKEGAQVLCREEKKRTPNAKAFSTSNAVIGMYSCTLPRFRLEQM